MISPWPTLQVRNQPDEGKVILVSFGLETWRFFPQKAFGYKASQFTYVAKYCGHRTTRLKHCQISLFRYAQLSRIIIKNPSDLITKIQRFYQFITYLYSE